MKRGRCTKLLDQASRSTSTSWYDGSCFGVVARDEFIECRVHGEVPPHHAVRVRGRLTSLQYRPRLDRAIEIV